GIQDLASVSLAGVKALEERTEHLQSENAELKSRLNTVEDQLKKQQAQIDELKKLLTPTQK
ncbi:MAG TPA: hypothetical protein VL501_08740, partial [Pyrinomonadaceae bacterium]|nr:hypothetical protein [Pyrinomonadaceae bacterium]